MGIEPLSETAKLRCEQRAERLHRSCTGALLQHSFPVYFQKPASLLGKSGAPWVIRTPDLLLRRQTLYPAELRARSDLNQQFAAFPLSNNALVLSIE